MVTQKEKHDGKKQASMERLEVRGFQESLKPQSDSPTASKESFKILMAISASYKFKLAFNSDAKKVMLEDGLKDVENLFDPEDLGGDTVGAKYLKMTNTVSFSDMCSNVIELPVSEHRRPEVKVAKRNEI